MGINETIDVFGFNYGISKYPSFRTHERNQDRAFHGSETASTVSSRGEYFFPVFDLSGDQHRDDAFTTEARGDFQVSSYDVSAPRWGHSPDHQFATLECNPDAFGEYVWTGFDYIGEPTPYNEDLTNLLNFSDPAEQARMREQLETVGKLSPPSRSSYFGILDLCGFKKDRFYIYQSQWRPELPMAHILPHWNWPGRVGQVTPVHVYTSGDEAELFLNGRSLGRRTKDFPLYRMVWDEVVYAPGELKVFAYKDGEVWAEDVMETTGAPAALRAEADRSIIDNDGLDLSFITLSIRDSEGRLVPRSHNEIEFTLEGPGAIVATGNGDATSHDSLHDMRHKAFNGLCQVIIRAEPGASGTITLFAKSDSLEPAEVAIETR
jgi:beta-galactosidase